MATRRKSASKNKKEETEVKPPVEEVVEPTVEEKAPEPLPVVEPEQPQAEEVPPPVPEEPKAEMSAKVEPVAEAVADVPVEVPAPVVEQKAEVVELPRMGIGSIVMTPTGKRCQVVGHAKGGKFRVQNLKNTRKVYAYEPSRLSLVK